MPPGTRSARMTASNGSSEPSVNRTPRSVNSAAPGFSRIAPARTALGKCRPINGTIEQGPLAGRGRTAPRASSEILPTADCTARCTFCGSELHRDGDVLNGDAENLPRHRARAGSDRDADDRAGAGQLHRDSPRRIARPTTSTRWPAKLAGRGTSRCETPTAELIAVGNRRLVRVGDDARGDDHGAGGRSALPVVVRTIHPPLPRRDARDVAPRFDRHTKRVGVAAEVVEEVAAGRKTRRGRAETAVPAAPRDPWRCAGRGCRTDAPTCGRSGRRARGRRARRRLGQRGRSRQASGAGAISRRTSGVVVHRKAQLLQRLQILDQRRRFASVGSAARSRGRRCPIQAAPVLNQLRSSPERRNSSASPADASADRR